MPANAELRFDVIPIRFDSDSIQIAFPFDLIPIRIASMRFDSLPIRFDSFSRRRLKVRRSKGAVEGPKVEGPKVEGSKGPGLW